MIHHQRIPGFRIACLATLSAFLCLFTDQSHAADIPASEITALQKDLTEIKSQSSAAKKRRSCKSIIRKGNSLIEASPAAPNRFHVLAIMFQSQKLLLSMDNSDRNRESLFEICGKLAKAPDTYATLRLDADLLFSNMTLDQKSAEKEGRIQALTALINRYRDTPAEPKCLMIAAMIARNIEARELENKIVTLMTERHASNADVVQFRLKNLGFGRADVPFTGNFKRADGTTLSFPVDQLGHASIVVFWSTQMPGHQEELKKIHEEMAPYATHLSVFSFNIDQLPDAGEKQLRALGLNWTAVHLPGGKNSRLAKIFAIPKPQGYLINPHGHILLMSSLAKYGRGHGAAKEILVSDQFMPHTRSMAQLQSLYIGDFLVLNPDKKITAIHDCFTPAPVRYRLTPEQTLANYTKAEKLCRELIAKSPTSPEIQQIRNYRIIALLGMWKTAIEPKHLQTAVDEANTALAANPPKGENIIPHFCLAVASLRKENTDAESTLTNFIQACGGDNAPATAHAAASILALDARSKSLHDHYREKLLSSLDENDATLWPAATFLRDRYHQFNLLHATDQRRERKESRSNIIHHNWSTSTRPFPNFTLKTLDGKTLTLPKNTQGKQTLVLFIEPPTEGDIPISLIGKPAEGKKRAQQGAVDYAWKRASEHIHNEVNMVVAFLTNDTNRIKALVKKHDWKFQVATVPNTISNPAIQQLGVISADQIANIFLLRRNGTIAWQTTGLKHKFSFSHQFSAYLGLTVHIELLDITLAYQALEKGDYKNAARLFAGPFAKKKDERFGWTAPRFHARALANMKLKQWVTALEDIDQAIAHHNPKSFRHDSDHPCDTMREMQAIRSIILKNLGKTDEAKAAEKISTQKHTPYRTGIYSDFHMKLKALRLKAEKNP
jgi:tetratricopeptide (TPR) repeat protein